MTCGLSGTPTMNCLPYAGVSELSAAELPTAACSSIKLYGKYQQQQQQQQQIFSLVL
jgi:hypothetical protein